MFVKQMANHRTDKARHAPATRITAVNTLPFLEIPGEDLSRETTGKKRH